MRFSSLTICFIINIIICFGIPIGYLIYLIAAKKRGIKSFFIGVLVFLISQVFLRLPIIQYILPKMEWYSIMTVLHPISYCIFLGATAGLFEEVGRFLGFKLALKKNRSWFDGLSFGMGHGGIEAMIISGASSVQNLLILISLNKGSYDSSKYGLSEERVRALFETTNSMNVLFGGIERIFAILLHIGLTLLILYGINKGKKRYLGLAILIHGAIDSSLAIFMNLGFSVYLVELLCGIYAAVLLIFSIKIKRQFKGEVDKGEEII
ncbi:YhfC family intramembrane metalloprotease [Clostridium sp. PL3]|uniref:YhfC family intramembrane metalloprotease n=1 Tax=Clostridium thailandense TaxID=2794346 RepID=A0A949TIB9_9CLOT|nr:YhfC family glutamic-type intramembrane protease [Clostridium thailandense]MBV7272775.1 YhfC family intramembrane metalloprotease [Clostridium thailandense]